MSDVGRPKNNDYPPHMTPDGGRGGFFVRNPINGKKKRFRADQEQEARTLALRLGELLEIRRQRTLLDAGRPKIGQYVDTWLKERLPLQPWDESTRKTATWRCERIKREMGERLFEDTDCTWLEDWLSRTAPKADPFNKWRQMLILIWRLAVVRKATQTNEAEKVERRSTSRKIESNRKTRRQLDVEGYKLIYAQGTPVLQLAMDCSLVTLQARREVCNFQHPDFRDGFLFVIRDKTAADSAMAFIKIRLTPELEALQARSRQLVDRKGNAIASPYLIHRRPDRMQRRWTAGKPHWSYVNEDYITQLFADARDKVARFKELPERERPSFHEIRGLGGRLYQAKGVAKEAIQALMTHSSPKTTAIYLERGPQALTNDDFVTVAAPFTVKELLGS